MGKLIVSTKCGVQISGQQDTSFPVYPIVDNYSDLVRHQCGREMSTIPRLPMLQLPTHRPHVDLVLYTHFSAQPGCSFRWLFKLMQAPGHPMYFDGYFTYQQSRAVQLIEDIRKFVSDEVFAANEHWLTLFVPPMAMFIADTCQDIADKDMVPPSASVHTFIPPQEPAIIQEALAAMQAATRSLRRRVDKSQAIDALAELEVAALDQLQTATDQAKAYLRGDLKLLGSP